MQFFSWQHAMVNDEWGNIIMFFIITNCSMYSDYVMDRIQVSRFALVENRFM